MLIGFSVENFQFFDDRQELVMIPAKKLKTNKEHVIPLNNVPVLRNATIYGANASGKTNIIDAIRFAKHVITKKIPMEASKMYDEFSLKIKKRKANLNLKSSRMVNFMPMGLVF